MTLFRRVTVATSKVQHRPQQLRFTLTFRIVLLQIAPCSCLIKYCAVTSTSFYRKLGQLLKVYLKV